MNKSRFKHSRKEKQTMKRLLSIITVIGIALLSATTGYASESGHG